MAHASFVTRAIPALALLLTVACAPIAVTPGIRTVPLESAQTVRRDHVAIRAGGGAHTDWVVAATGQGGVSVGLDDELELQLDGSFAWVQSLESRAVSPFAAAGRVGIKHQPVDWLALTVGVGAGAGPWGGFVGGDLGIIFAYENPYVVPFFALRMQIGLPVNGQTERIVEMQSGGSETVRLLDPTTSLWFQPSTGIRIPICTDDACEGVRVSLTAAFAWSALVAIDQEHNAQVLGGEAGLQIEL